MEHFITTWGYLALVVVTVAEAACVPIPSEVTIGVAGYLASAAGNHKLNLVAVIAVASVGEVLGSLVGYAIGRFGGRPLLENFGRYLLISSHDLDRAENWLDGRGEWSVLVGRVLPLVRTFVALAAGMAEMQLARFVVMTALGSVVWIAVVGTVAYHLGGAWNHLTKGFSMAGYVVAAVVVLTVATFVVHRLRSMRSSPAESEAR